MNHFIAIMANNSVTSLISYMITAVIILALVMYYAISRYRHLLSKDYSQYLNHQRQTITKKFAISGPNNDALLQQIFALQVLQHVSWIYLWCFLAALQLMPHNALDTLLALFLTCWLLAMFVRKLAWPTVINPERQLKPLPIICGLILELAAYVCLIWSLVGALGAITVIIHMI